MIGIDGALLLVPSARRTSLTNIPIDVIDNEDNLCYTLAWTKFREEIRLVPNSFEPFRYKLRKFRR